MFRLDTTQQTRTITTNSSILRKGDKIRRWLRCHNLLSLMRFPCSARLKAAEKYLWTTTSDLKFSFRWLYVQGLDMTWLKWALQQGS